MRSSARWPIVLLPPACLLVVFLSIMAWRLVSQEQAVERERLRERLENAVSLVLRESGRAVAETAADDRMSVSLAWDSRGVRRTKGAPLAWLPAPEPLAEAPEELFARGEALETAAAQPERAIVEYSQELGNPRKEIRAGALVRIARCQRKLGRRSGALATYQRLADLGAVPVAGAFARLIGHRERAALFDAAGESANASKERGYLASALEHDSYAIDRATFAFYTEGVPIRPEALRWPVAVEQLWARAHDAAHGSAILEVQGSDFLAEWSRDGSKGTGQLLDFAEVNRRLARTLEGVAFSWQLTDAGGARIAGGEAEGVPLMKKPAETGLAWGIKVAAPSWGVRSITFLLAGGMILLSLAIAGTLYLAYRAVQRELSVAKMQQEFVAAVSHEFRTPITALTHLTEMLESGNAAEDRKPLYFKALARETRRLREMVENLLDFGRIEAGRYKYKPEEIDVVEFAVGVVDEFRAQAAAEGRELRVEHGTIRQTLTADRETLRRAVWNLLDNAAKYSPAASRITTRMAEENGWISLSVQDQGPGIPPAEQKRIFQKFVRGQTAGVEQIKGTGIGLAMVEAIARAHGGRVDLESTPSAGSRFTIVLPCARRQ